MDLNRIYKMIREGDRSNVGASYLIDHYKRGRIGIMRPDGEPALTAWQAGRDAAVANEPSPYKLRKERPVMSSAHVWKAREKAADMGAFAGDPAAADLWHLSKRELVEIALRLTMEDGVDAAIERVREERRILKQNRII